ncbi:LuxE/PaaK family acyltransferase [Nafulsella turpanensis]|uniref:LuxE/PaaK family acyltransferase n=1 Tax=Nafulsella turpanensis TaxID=1265690 RepID=UPI00034735A3|nr:acyltransferase [Nafulsella turpanensis]
MKNLKDLQSRVLQLSPADFEDLALEVFNFQAQENVVYGEYLQHLNVEPSEVSAISGIPFMPIDFFKTKSVRAGQWTEEGYYESSGTGYGVRSRHYIQDIGFYQQGAQKAFERLYGPLSQFAILALLPSYLEREHSSLVAMADFFMSKADSKLSGFYLYEHKALLEQVERVKKAGKKLLLIGVSFALLDLAEEGADLSGAIVMETGGMKGRRKEMIRAELHEVLKKGLGIAQIHSEYGMTELLSQAYARREGLFETPPWMKVYIRDLNDPFSFVNFGRSGGVNVVDLANVHSCAFVETQDIGISHPNGTFEILGRFDNSEIRGCNLLLFS